MKKNVLVKLLFMIILAAVCSSCMFFVDGTVGKGPISEQNIAVSNFYKIESLSSAEVTIEKGDSLQVILSDYENLIEFWDIKVVDNTLLIQTKPFSSLINSKAKVSIITPSDLTQVKVSGSGHLLLNDEFPELEKASITGSGNIIGNVNTGYSTLSLTISGSGSFNLTGTATDLRTTTSGSGRMNLFDITTQTANCTISGSGNVYVNVVDYLNAVISGSGNVLYKGNPVVDVHSSGSGNVRHSN